MIASIFFIGRFPAEFVSKTEQNSSRNLQPRKAVALCFAQDDEHRFQGGRHGFQEGRIGPPWPEPSRLKRVSFFSVQSEIEALNLVLLGHTQPDQRVNDFQYNQG